MNERDYHIMEYMALSSGSMIMATVVFIFWRYSLPIDYSIVLLMSFVAFITFFFGLAFHMKRRIYKKEFEELIEREKHEKN